MVREHDGRAAEGADDAVATATAGPGKSAEPELEHPHLLVVDSGSSWRFDLPRSGFVLIGRAPEAELRLEHSSVSRRQARILMDGGVARVVDLGSHNGTRVNGEPLDRTRLLASGDVIAAGDVLLVVQEAARPAAERTLLGDAELARRLAEELERALTYRRPLVVVATAGVPAAAMAAAAAAAAAALRGMDVLATGADGQLVALLPERAAAGASDAAARLVAALAAAAPEARAGVAACPADACDADSLLLLARAAARAAAPGQVAGAEAVVQRIELPGRGVLLAHPATVRVYELIRRLAATDLPVLVVGETGAGKENAALAVHAFSARRAGPFVAMSCAAVPEGLLESELFGFERGAFTGATAAKAGLLESAAGGTFFLDEVGELAPAAQAKLLRVLESKRVTRLGDVRERDLDVRLVAASNRDLAAEVRAGRFRQDLYFRLGAATVLLPPLRERRCEIPILARAFLAEARARAVQPPLELSPAALQALLLHDWPGNVRELRNVADFLAATVDDVVQLDDLRAALSLPAAAAVEPAEPEGGLAAAAPPLGNLAEELRALERRRMVEALEAAGGVRTRAAALIGMPIRTFTWKLKQHGLGAKG